MHGIIKNHKNHKQIVKIVKKKIVNVKNQYKPLEIQPIPFYLIVICFLLVYTSQAERNRMNLGVGDVKIGDKANAIVIVLQLTPMVDKDVYLLVSGSRVINPDTSML